MEYAKYIAPKYVDWTGITDKFAAAVTDVGVKREKAKQDLADINQQSLQNINDLQMTKTESFNNKLITLQDKGRENNYKWYKQLINGEITPSQYKRLTSNLNNSIATLANTAKTYDDRLQEYIKRQQKDENGKIIGSSVESDYYLANFGLLSDLKDKQFEVGDDGTISVAQYDADGKKLGQASIDSVNRVDNMLLNRVDVNSSVQEFAKNTEGWQTWRRVLYNGEKTIDDIRQMPDFKIWKQQVAQAVAGSPDRMLSVLVDNGGLKYPAIYAHNEQEAKQKVAQSIQNENDTRRRAGVPELTPDEIKEMSMSVIRMDGNGKPLLTEEQADKAYELVRRSLEYQLGHKEEGSAGSLPSFSGGGDGDGRGDNYAVTPMYERLRKAWNEGKDGISVLNSLSSGEWKFEWSKNGGMSVYTEKPVLDVLGEQAKDSKGNPKFIREYAAGDPNGNSAPAVRNLIDLAPYFYGEGTDAKGQAISLERFKKEKDAYLAKNPEKKKKNSSTTVKGGNVR